VCHPHISDSLFTKGIRFGEVKNMKNRSNVKVAVAAFLILTFAISLIAIPEAVAQNTKAKTFGFSFATPQLIGKGQTVWVVGWVSPPTGVSNQKYANLTLVLTKPDGTVVNKFFDFSDVGAAVNTQYVCDKVGTWSVMLSWPGDATHEGCQSQAYSWTVQTDKVDLNPTMVPLPTGYWKFPISAEFYDWFKISGPWTQARYDATQAQFNAYSLGPKTPHVLWRNQVTPGGLVGGEQEWYSIQGTFAPNTEGNVGLANYVAANGRLYYTTRDFTTNYTTTRVLLHCVNQYTGEQIYAVDLDWPLAAPSTNPNAFPPGRPNLFLEVTGQQKGGSDVRQATVTGAYSLWVSGNGLREIDPMTGMTIYQRTDVSPSVYSNGYFYFSQSGNLTKWSTRAKVNSWVAPGMPSPTYVYDDMLVYSSKSYNSIITTTTFDAKTGAMIANGTINQYSVTLSQCIADGKIFYSCCDLCMHAVDLRTCREVWVSEPMAYPWGSDQAYSQSAAYGMVYSGMLDGYIYAFNTTNGNLVWKCFGGNTTETAFGTYPFWGNIVVADGKLYCATGEHTTPNPIPYGYSLYCIDAFTGNVIWNVPSFCMYTFASVGFGSGISAGMLWYQNIEDGCLYMFGKGQTTTTVTAAPKVSTQGSAVLLEGTVLDLSPGSKGTPAISDRDQTAWEQYLYNNRPKPENANGVPVHLAYVDGDNAVHDIGDTTSDTNGNYAYSWVPPATGTYHIKATFAGTDAYYNSDATTYIDVSSAAATPTQTQTPTATPTQNPTATPASTTAAPEPKSGPDTVIYAAVAAVVILVAVIAAAIVLRKRK
jgi:hypothetical protein